jgi:hypothetical protein
MHISNIFLKKNQIWQVPFALSVRKIWGQDTVQPWLLASAKFQKLNGGGRYSPS